MGSEFLGGLLLLPILLLGLALAVTLPLAALLDIHRKYTIPVFLLASIASFLSAGGLAVDTLGNRHFPPMFFVFLPFWSLLFFLCTLGCYRFRCRRT